MTAVPGRIDLHMHSTVSDGTDTPEELLARVKEAGIALFSLTDHDAVKGVKAIRNALCDSDPQFLSGVEFSCKDAFGQYHILGYGFDPDAKQIQALVEDGHRFRMEKVTARLDYLKERYGVSFPPEEVETLLAMDNPGKPHIGNLMVRYGYAASKETAIRDFIDRLGFTEEYLRPEQAICGVLSAGGIPVLAHPWFGSGEQRLSGPEMHERLSRLKGFGLLGVEAYYSGFSLLQRTRMLELAEEFGLFVTAGSDYHGANKPVALGQTGFAADAAPPDSMLRFLERAGIPPELAFEV